MSATQAERTNVSDSATTMRTAPATTIGRARRTVR